MRGIAVLVLIPAQGSDCSYRPTRQFIQAAVPRREDETSQHRIRLDCRRGQSSHHIQLDASPAATLQPVVPQAVWQQLGEIEQPALSQQIPQKAQRARFERGGQVAEPREPSDQLYAERPKSWAKAREDRSPWYVAVGVRGGDLDLQWDSAHHECQRCVRGRKAERRRIECFTRYGMNAWVEGVCVQISATL